MILVIKNVIAFANEILLTIIIPRLKVSKKQSFASSLVSVYSFGNLALRLLQEQIENQQVIYHS